MTDQTEPEDTCRPVEIDGETIRVHGSGEMSDESRAALADVIRAAKRKHLAEHPPIEPSDPERRERYAEALYNTLEVSPTRHPWPSLSPLRRAVWYARADAAMKLADAEVAAVSAGGAPADWIDGHPQLEAIAAAVWERCGRSDSGTCVEDDPRNIAAAALAAVLPATTDRATVLREAADLYANLTDQNEAYDLAEDGAIDEESRIRYDTVRDVVAGLRRMAAEAGPADTGQDGGEAPADPWSISYHQLGPARNNPAVCTCGLGPDAVIHNEPPHQFNGRPKPGMPPVHGICTDCHHHETAACHTKPEQSAAAQQPQEA